MLISTTETIHGKRIVKTLGLATGTVTRSPGFVRGVIAMIKNLLGGELQEFTKTIAEAREQSLDRMREQARSLGANAVVSVRFSSAEIASYAAEILVYGTAVVVEDEAAGKSQGP